MIDQIIIGLYLVVTLIIGLMVGRKTNTISDFAVGKRNFPTIVLVSTVFASVVDGNGTLGLAEAIFSQGPFYCLAFLGIIFSYFGLAFFIAPKFDPFLGLLSSGDVLGSLYGPKAKVFMGFATVFESTMLTGVQVLAMTHIIQYFFAIPASIAAFGSSLIILLYSLRGGIRAVTATDIFQFGVLIIAIPVIAGIALSKIGGFDGLFIAINSAHLRTAPEIDYSRHLAVFASFALPALFPLTIQRMLMAKNTKQISSTFMVTGALSLPFYLTISIIAISALVLLPSIEPNFVFPALINEVMPVGIKGFVIAGLLAVFMSSIDSSLNVASIAVTHDICTPLSKNSINEISKLRIARVSSIVLGILATVTALYFNNIIGMMYFLLCISNSAFFPGYLVGLMGLKPSPTGFWTGLISAVISVLFLTFVVGLFELYTGLISITINVAVLTVFHWKESHLPNIKEIFSEKINKPKFLFTKPTFNLNVKNPGYCDTFAIFALINAVIPFFLLSPQIEFKNSPYLSLYFVSALLAFSIIFRESWWERIRPLFSYVWHLLLIISLPGLTLLMCLHTKFEPLLVFDLIISFFLMIILTNKKMFSLSVCIGAILAFFINYISGDVIDAHVSDIGKWSILSHMLTMTFCLLIFRKQDIQSYKFLSGKLAHEASRSLSSMSVSAEFLKLKLPDLISSYEWAQQNGYSAKPINAQVIEELKVLPSQLQNMGQRTAKTLDTLLGKILPSSEQVSTMTYVDIFTCVKDAIDDPSITNTQRAKIKLTFEAGFIFFGDQAQISQTVLNIIENALNAISQKPNGHLEIWTTETSLFIRDNGIGISPKDLPNIFDEFFSTKKTLGEGLAFCKEVMDEHKGAIYCESEEGKFTQFELIFPKWS
jgi:Na+/proline symporter/signal transduction histidine kinase